VKALKVIAVIIGVVFLASISASIAWSRSHQKFEKELDEIKTSLNTEVPLGSKTEMAKAYFANHRFIRSGMADYRSQPQFQEIFGASAVYTGIKNAQSGWTPSFIGCGSGGGFQVNLAYDSGLKLKSRTVKPFFTCM